MAYAMTKQGSLDNCVTYEFVCDTIADMNTIENKYRTIGSIAVVLSGESEGMEVYIADSKKSWISLSGVGADADSLAGGGLTIYICPQDEVDNGVPNVSEPDESTVYLVSNGGSSGNLYNEFIYVNNAWEKWGSADIDLSNYATKSEIPDVSGYAPKANPEFTGSISLGRKANTTIGTGSVAIGSNVEASGNYSSVSGAYTIASGNYSHAEGYGSTYATRTKNSRTFNYGATSDYSHVEGYYTIACSSSAHAEGGYTIAAGQYSHAEGNETIAYYYASHAEGQNAEASGAGSHAEGLQTKAQSDYSHAEGCYTIASGRYTHASGRYNVDNPVMDTPPAWESGHQYQLGDKISIEQTVYGQPVTNTYACMVVNNDNEFTASKWYNLAGIRKYIDITGNGFDSLTRRNARALDWEGNEYLMGDLYVGCTASSGGGTKLARIPDPPTTDGTYNLQATVSSGTITYSWVAAPASASGVSF